MGQKTRALKISRGEIRDRENTPVKLRGFNLGGWLLMEGFLLGGRNIPEHRFIKSIFEKMPRGKASELLENFWANFISESDFEKIKSLGFNCVRLPFHYKIFKDYPLKNAAKYLHKAVDLCGKYGIYCILDMHAAPGSQNADWHSDSSGKSLFWENRKYRELAVEIWENLALKYKNAPQVAGFNILNEPVTDKIQTAVEFYNTAIQRINALDKNRLIFLDGLAWSTDFSFIEKIKNTENVVLSPHFYNPIDYVFNFTPGLKYPGMIKGEYWDKNKLKSILTAYAKAASKVNCPVFIGEFGLNTYGNNSVWAKHAAGLFNQLGFGWAYWSYKSVFNYLFPSGLFLYTHNSPWIKREGPLFGWENYINLDDKNLRMLYGSWKTKNYSLNKALLEALQSG